MGFRNMDSCMLILLRMNNGEEYKGEGSTYTHLNIRFKVRILEGIFKDFARWPILRVNHQYCVEVCKLGFSRMQNKFALFFPLYFWLMCNLGAF